MKIGFIGCGKMGEAILSSICGSAVMPENITVSDLFAERLSELNSEYGVKTTESNIEVVRGSDIVFLATKPQEFPDLLASIASDAGSDQIFISIAAGRMIKDIQGVLSVSRIVRVMPNLGAFAAESMNVFCCGEGLCDSDIEKVSSLLSASGKVLQLPEAQFDAVTALSGSGPAFLAHCLLAMVNGAVQQGLSSPDALLLAQQTMLGTARVLQEKSYDLTDFIAAVRSKKGTTDAGLNVLENSDIDEVLSSCIEAAAERSRELSS